ncbi:MAG: MerR family transcriptional regulator, partial [Vicinamibacterales bacterium]
YVLRSWEKEFAGIGVQKSADAPRLYRESDLAQVLRIKQLVFGEGLTLAGARRRLEGDPVVVEPTAAEAVDAADVLDSDARRRIGAVRDGLRSLLAMLETRPASFALASPGAASASVPVRERSGAQRGAAARSTKTGTAKAVAKGKRATA